MAEETKPTVVPAEQPTAAEPSAAAPAAATAAAGEETNPDGTPLSDKQKKKRAEKAEKQRQKEERAAKLAAEKAAKENEADFAAQYYGQAPLNQSQERPRLKWTSLHEVDSSKDGERVHLQVRVQSARLTSAKLGFLVLRERLDVAQAVIAETPEKISRKMIKWACSLPNETLVVVQGVVNKVAQPISSAAITIKDAEIKIEQIHSVTKVIPTLEQKFSVQDATRSDAEVQASQSTAQPMPIIGLDTRLDNRVLDLRTPTNQAIFQVQAAVGNLFREFLTNENFVEIHTAKLQGGATESGATVFEVKYFNGKAFLAQSPQLCKQIAIAADFDRVFEIGPVFRAENSNTARHMTEFIGLDLEMAFKERYHEALELTAELFHHIFRELPKRYGKQIDIIKKQYPIEEFLVPEKPVILHWADGIKLLRENGIEWPDFEDLDTPTEKKLGALVRQKYQTDFYVLDQFPSAIRPFYTMPNGADPRYSNSFDMFMRGQEVLSGAQRIHDADLLVSRMKELGVPPESLQPYVDAFKLGAPPHAGGGIGLERVVEFYLGLGNIRLASMFPRDPKRLEP